MSNEVPQRPSLKQLISRILSDIDYRLPGASARPRRSLLTVLGMMNAYVFHSLYGYVDALKVNILPNTCSDTWLPLWGVVMAVPRLESVQASGRVLFLGESGVSIALGSRLTLSNQTYITTAAGIVGEFINIQALIAGLAGNAPAGSTLILESPIAGVEADATVDYLNSGADQETLNAWRSRIVKAFNERDKIGDKDDYESWALSAHPAITDAWVFPNTMGLGEITIALVCGDSLNPVPDQLIIDNAKHVIDRIRNAGATTHIIPPTIKTIDIRIKDIAESQRQAVTESIQSLFKAKQTQNAEIEVEEIHAAIQAVWQSSYTLLAPLAKQNAISHELMIMGEPQWT